jgi:hypothetical protein
MVEEEMIDVPARNAAGQYIFLPSKGQVKVFEY